ncbi:MAG: winged helix-turn-helix domain-containing protein [Steroidobacteraceae bacterium]
MPQEPAQIDSLSFGECTLDCARGTLLRNDVEVRLRPQSHAVLRYLAEHAGRLVTRAELFSAVWGHTVVTDDSLTQCLIEIRRALGDPSHELIRTVPKRGYIFELPVRTTTADEPRAIGSAAVRHARKWLWSSVAVCAVLATAAVVVSDGQLPVAGEKSIAVLAFSSPDSKDKPDFFADVFSLDILNLLARAPDLRVISQASSMSLRGTAADVTALGKMLDVDYVLTGSVRRAVGRVHATARLVHTPDRTRIWTGTFDRRLTDLLQVKRAIAQAVAGSLGSALPKADPRARVQASNREAHEQFQIGRFLFGRRAAGDVTTARWHFEQAVRLDPQFAPAWAALAGTCLVGIFAEGLPAGPQLARMHEAVVRALALDPKLPAAHVRAAQYYWHSGANFAVAQRQQLEALRLDPENTLVLTTQAGMDAALGNYAGAVRRMRMAVRTDPLNFAARGNLANWLAVEAEYGEALREYRYLQELQPAHEEIGRDIALLTILQGHPDKALESITRWPEGPAREQALALAFLGLHRTDDAEEAIEALRQRRAAESALRLAEIAAQRGDRDEAFRLLEIERRVERDAALTPGDARYPYVFPDSYLLNPLRSDPRWRAVTSAAPG